MSRSSRLTSGTCLASSALLLLAALALAALTKLAALLVLHRLLVLVVLLALIMLPAPSVLPKLGEPLKLSGGALALLLELGGAELKELGGALKQGSEALLTPPSPLERSTLPLALAPQMARASGCPRGGPTEVLAAVKAEESEAGAPATTPPC
jgi:hypothetical protein